MASILAESKTLEQSYATGSPNQRKLFCAKEMFWVFFSDGRNLEYRTSQDGRNWNAAIKTAIETGPTAESVSIWKDEQTNEIYIARQRHGDKDLALERGVLESNGSISCFSPSMKIKTKFPGQFPGTFVCSRSNNEIWIGTTTIDKQENRHTEIWKSDGHEAWLAYDTNFGPHTAIRPSIILPAPVGVLLIYGRTHHSDKLFITATEDGRNWLTPLVAPGNFCLGGAITIGGELYYCGPSEENCRFFKFSINSSQFDRDLVLESENVSQAVLASDGHRTMVAVYASIGPSCSIFYRVSKDLGETWGERKVLIEKEPIKGFSLNSSREITKNEIGVSWSSGIKSPFKVKFEKIQV